MDNSLVIFSHPDLEHSALSKRLVKAYIDSPHIDFTDLYEEYAGFNILMFREIRSILSHQNIIFHFPLVWYGLPPLFKLWLDEVMEVGYKTDGRLHQRLEGKKVSFIVTLEEKFMIQNNDAGFEWNPEIYLQPLMKFIHINKMNLENNFVFDENDKTHQLEFDTHFDTLKNVMKF